jgi:hypothetical protein
MSVSDLHKYQASRDAPVVKRTASRERLPDDPLDQIDVKVVPSPMISVSASCRGWVSQPSMAAVLAATDARPDKRRRSSGPSNQWSHPAGLIPSTERRVIDDGHPAGTGALIEEFLADKSKHVEPPCLLSQTAGRARLLFPTLDAKRHQN